MPEALARLTEVYLALGLKDQARKTASVLGYNYPGSEWYNASYAQLVDDGVAKPADKASGGDTERPGFMSRAWHAVF